MASPNNRGSKSHCPVNLVPLQLPPPRFLREHYPVRHLPPPPLLPLKYPPRFHPHPQPNLWPLAQRVLGRRVQEDRVEPAPPGFSVGARGGGGGREGGGGACGQEQGEGAVGGGSGQGRVKEAVVVEARGKVGRPVFFGLGLGVKGGEDDLEVTVEEGVRGRGKGGVGGGGSWDLEG
jgi:hypothetical protein